MTNGLITMDVFLKQLKGERKKHKTNTEFAAKLGVSQQFLDRVLRGAAYPGPTIAGALGFEQLVAFRPAPRPAKKARKAAAGK